MWHRLFIIVSLIMLASSSLAWSYPRSLALDEPVTSMSPILIDEEIPPSGPTPRIAPPSKPAEPAELAEAPKAPAKAPSFFERVKGLFGKVTSFIEPLKPVADGFVKETGAKDLLSKGQELFAGNVKVITQAIEDTKAKKQARLAAGENPGFFTDMWDGFSSTFFPLLAYNSKEMLLPLAKVVLGMPSVAKQEAAPAPKQATAAA